MASRPTNPADVLAALLRADAADPALVPSLTRAEVAAATGRSLSQVAHAIERGHLRAVPGVRNGHSCSLIAPLEAARFVREGNRVPAA